MSAPTIPQQARSASPGPVHQVDDGRTLGQLVGDLTEELPELIRAELRLAQAEVAQKGKSLGIGAGLLGAGGVVALLAAGAGIATAILGLATVLDAWLAALVVTGALLLVAGLLALVGQVLVKRGVPPVPERAIAGAREDLDVLKEVRP